MTYNERAGGKTVSFLFFAGAPAATPRVDRGSGSPVELILEGICGLHASFDGSLTHTAPPLTWPGHLSMSGIGFRGDLFDLRNGKLTRR